MEDQQMENSIAKFEELKISEIISGPQQGRTLREFLKLFNFSDLPLLEALRKFLSRFEMKGETQEQDRILQAFAARYVDTNSSLGNSVDSVHRLVYAFVLLNTDLHSKNLESHMTANQFVTNTMSSDLNEKLDERFLVECYQSIRQNPILRPPQTSDRPPSSENTGRANLSNLIRSISTRKFHISINSVRRKSLAINPEAPDPHKSGMVIRKHVLSSEFSRASNRQWKVYYVELMGSDMVFLKSPPNGQSLHACTKPIDHLPLRQAFASPIRNGYSRSKPFVFQLKLYGGTFILELLSTLTTNSGALYVFQVDSAQSLDEWVSLINFWAAKESRGPLPVPIGNIWYGYEKEWLLDFIPGIVDESQSKPELATGAVNRLQKETRESDFIDWGNNNVATYKSAIDEPCNAENMRGLFEETTCDSIQDRYLAAARKFGDVRDESISSWTPPYLPFVPASLSSKVEEITLRGEAAKTSAGPLGFDKEHLIDSDKQLQMWSDRHKQLLQDMRNHLESREIMKYLGIGKGIQETLASMTNLYYTYLLSSAGGKSPNLSALRGNENVAFGCGGNLSEECLEWNYKMAPITAGFSDAAFAFVDNDMPNSLSVKLPAPSNITLQIPLLPKKLLLAASPRSKNAMLPNFTTINKRLALRVDRNWQVKFSFLQWELCKVAHYVKALQHDRNCCRK